MWSYYIFDGVTVGTERGYDGGKKQLKWDTTQRFFKHDNSEVVYDPTVLQM